jgi:hypothetical protein
MHSEEAEPEGTRFDKADLVRARFHKVDLSRARFDEVDLTASRLRNIDLTGAQIRGALLVDVELDGYVEGLSVNGVDVGPLVEAELDRRHPGRTAMRPSDAEGFRQAWAILERLWPETIERARRLPAELLHERVDDEWSFLETQRHLLFVVDAWVKRAVLGDPSPYHPLDLAHDEREHDAPVPYDPGARPTLDEVLPLRAERTTVVRDLFAGLTDDVLAGTTAVTGPGYPEAGTYPVRRCLRAVVNEEWEHRLIAERDLAVLEARTSRGPG